tara:strand:+ start:11653 stop:11808 length:156 start_codon:yes stop_codon:yes gene_type:complete
MPFSSSISANMDDMRGARKDINDAPRRSARHILPRQPVFPHQMVSFPDNAL